MNKLLQIYKKVPGLIIASLLFSPFPLSIMKSNKLLAFLIPLFMNTCYADKNVEQHLAEGNQFLVTGKYNDAIMSFDAAIRK